MTTRISAMRGRSLCSMSCIGCCSASIRITYVRNITDIDDKINARSAESGERIEITARTTAQFHEDIAALGALPPDVEPRNRSCRGDG